MGAKENNQKGVAGMKKRLFVLMLVLGLIFSLAACKKAKGDELTPPETDDQVEQPVDTPEEEEKLFYVLYRKHKELPYIYADAFEISSKDPRLEGTTLEAFVVQELINQEGVEDLINPIPKGTKVLSVKKEDGLVTVDLSKEFVENMKGTEETVMTTTAVIVNSLLTLPGNQRVQLLVEGKPVENLLGADLSKSFDFMEDYYGEK